jgi:predicted  nucleic acid-binding Zn-ribbon protein
LDDALRNPAISAEQLKNKMLDLVKYTAGNTGGEIKSNWEKLAKALKDVENEAELTKEKLMGIIQSSDAFKALNSDIELTDEKIEDLKNSVAGMKGMDKKGLQDFINKLKEMGIIAMDTQVAMHNTGDSFNKLQAHVATTSEAVMSFASALM